MAGAKIKASRKGMKLSKEAQEKKEKKEKITFTVLNPNNVTYDDHSILFCSSVLGRLVYSPCRGNERIVNLFADAKINEVTLTVIKKTGDAI